MQGYFLGPPRSTDKTTLIIKVRKGAKIRNRYSPVPHPTHDTNGKATNSQLDTTNESQEVSHFPVGDHKAHIKRRAQRHSKHKTHIYPHKKYRLGTASKIFYRRALTGLTVHQPMKGPLLINASSPRTYKSRYKKEIKQR